MLKFIYLLAIVFYANSLYAQSSVADISRAITALGAYEAQFELNPNDMTIKGGYQVDGERFYLYLGEIELYGEGELRYQIDGASQTVLIDVAQQDDSALLLDNPANAFDFASQLYDEVLLSSEGGVSIILLKAKDEADALISSIVMMVNDTTWLPISINYASNEDSVELYFTDIKSINSGAIAQFNVANYPDFEIVDFR